MKIDKEYILKFLRHNKDFLRKEFGVSHISDHNIIYGVCKEHLPILRETLLKIIKSLD